jgi:hypothetical protein
MLNDFFTIRAFFRMTAYGAAAFFAFPFFHFVFHVLFDAVIPYVDKIIGQAEAVPGNVSFVQLCQPFAREVRAGMAKPCFFAFDFFAVVYDALYAVI